MERMDGSLVVEGLDLARALSSTVSPTFSAPVAKFLEHWAQIVAPHFLQVLVEEEPQPLEYLHICS